jgi:hypothetical protein
MFRYNLRKMSDTERFNLSLSNVNGRLDYRTLVKKTPGNGYEQVTFEPKIAVRENRIVIQLKNGVEIARFKNPSEAARLTGCKSASIHRILKGKKKTTGGFEWKYE